jgi:hypothetical protein
MIKIKERKNESSEVFPLYIHQEIVYTCLNKVSRQRGRPVEIPWGSIGGCSNGRNVLMKMSQSFWCSYYCIFSYIAIIFFFKSSQVLQLIPLLKADLEAREYLVLYNVVMFPRRGTCIHIKHWRYMLHQAW